ncbi:MAG: hypothetical protein ABIL46_07625 [candidate division WOR-3 bacterium]
MTPLTPEKLLQNIQILLKNYDCYDIYYLDKNGSWQKNPQTLRDIISSEVWFRIWESFNISQNEGQIISLFNTIINNENFQNLLLKFKNTSESTEIDITYTLSIFELLYALIEYQCLVINTEQYIPEWDYKERKKQSQYLSQKNEFETNLRNLLNKTSLYDSFLNLHQEIKKNELFNFITAIINEQNKFCEQQTSVKAILDYNKKFSDIYETLNVNINLDFGYSITQGKSLVRPLIKILKDDWNMLNPGLKFEIVSMLGALKDPRCARTLVNLLKITRPENTNLISNIVYVLGNVHFIEMSYNLKEILQLPDYVNVSTGYKIPVYDVKSEAIWTIGKLGILGKNLINEMAKYRYHKDNTIKIALAWALGIIGAEEKKKEGAVDLEILTTLLEFLNVKDKKLFEEAIYSLKKIGFYEIIEQINFTNIPATPILSLKPSSIGLYELSETIYHLMGLKQPVVMAVTGDSGTGKTYFCEVIKNGFGDIPKDEILYLMRDNPAHRTMFSRMIDQEFVKDFLDPQYYTIEMMDEKKLSPSEAFSNFIKQHSHKKLIILDGWLDEIYFYQVLKTFYQFNYLDCVVNFRTTYSTRRINLETREGILERVKDCLRFVENPPIEETEFYRNGDVFIYNLDNSIGSRLSSEEIKEVFSRKKVGLWADYIRIGRFHKEEKELIIIEEAINTKKEKYTIHPDSEIAIGEEPIDVQTEHFSRILNENLSSQPNLLQTINLDKTAPMKISYYSPGMIAYSNKDGMVGILTGVNNQNLYTKIKPDKLLGHCHYNELLCLAHSSSIHAIDFTKNRKLVFTVSTVPISAFSSDRSKNFITGHYDGTIRLWDFEGKKTSLLLGHKSAIISLLITKNKNIISCGIDGEVRIWNLGDGSMEIFNDSRFTTEYMSTFRFFNNIIFLKNDTFIVLNPELEIIKLIKINEIDKITAFYPYYDGRIFAGFEKNDKYGLIVLEDKFYKIISFLEKKIDSILIMGPRIITTSEMGLNIWGSENYVNGEIEKLKILKESRKPFYYHSMIF